MTTSSPATLKFPVFCCLSWPSSSSHLRLILCFLLDERAPTSSRIIVCLSLWREPRWMAVATLTPQTVDPEKNASELRVMSICFFESSLAKCCLRLARFMYSVCAQSLSMRETKVRHRELSHVCVMENSILLVFSQVAMYKRRGIDLENDKKLLVNQKKDKASKAMRQKGRNARKNAAKRDVENRDSTRYSARKMNPHGDWEALCGLRGIPLV